MTQNFTPFDLIAYVYGEITPLQVEATEAALAADPILSHEMDELIVAKESLPRIKFNAPKRVLNSILGYSQESHHLVLC